MIAAARHGRTGRRRALGAGAAVAAALLLDAGTAFSQSAAAPDCNVTPATAFRPLDVCQKVSDLFAFLAPQIGVALAGGNPMLGEGGTLGGLGKVSVSLHATLVDGRVPKNAVTINPTGPAVSSDFGAKRAPVPMPAADAAVGLYRGVPFGLTNIGGIDLLIGAAYVPDVNREPVSITTDGRGLAISYGVRVGILQESALAPGVSVSIKRRRLPTASFLYTPNNDTLTVNRASVSTQSVRFVAAKRFVFAGLAAGFGRDVIDSKSAFAAVVNESGVPRLSVSVPSAHQKVSRSTAFANLILGLPQAQLVLEAGWSSAGADQPTVNTFGAHSANEGYRYASIGFGFRFP